MPTSLDQIAAAPLEVNPQDVRVWNDDGTGQGQRQMGNLVGTLLALATRTTNLNGIAMANPNHRGIVLHLAIGTPVGGTAPTIQLRLNAINPITGVAFAVWTPAALAPPVANTEYAYALYPAALAEAFTVAMNGVLPRTWSVDVILGGTGPSVPFSLGYELLL